MEEVKMIGSNAGEDFYNSDIIENKIKERRWTINDIIQKEEIVTEIAKEILSELDIETKYYIICDTEIPKRNMSFAKAIYNKTFDILEEWITAKLALFLKSATVNFNDEPIEALESFIEEGEGELESNENSDDEDEKVMTLKERIKLDTKQLDDKEMKKRGMK